MAADPTNLAAFAEAIIDQAVALQLPAGGVVQLRKDELLAAAQELQELQELREAVAQPAERNPEDAYNAQVVEDLVAYATQLGDQVDPQLVRIIEQAEDDDEPVEHDPQLVQVVLGGLRMLGVPAASPEQSSALLDMIAAYVDQQQGPGTHAAPQQIQQVMSPESEHQAPAGRRLVPVPAGVPIQMPPGVAPQAAPSRITLPTPANPPPFREVTAEELFGLRRGANGRYDSGDLGG